MIEQSVYDELLKEWAKYGYVYSTKGCINHRLKHFEEHCCPKLEGKKVLELACNAGVFAYVIAQHAASYIGVEAGKLIPEPKHPDIDYFMQLKETVKKIQNPNVTVINKTVGGFVADLSNEDFNALVVNFALYHFKDEEIQDIAEKILPKCDTVCIQNRSKERKIKKNTYKFWKARKIVEWLTKHGFECHIVWGDTDKSYSEIIGVRSVPTVMSPTVPLGATQPAPGYRPITNQEHETVKANLDAPLSKESSDSLNRGLDDAAAGRVKPLDEKLLAPEEPKANA